MGFFERLLGKEEQPDKTQGNWYDPEPTEPTRYNHSSNRLVNGGLRDLLGALADAHAESQGMTPLYGAKRQQERIGEAMDGYGTDPMAAIQGVAKINAPLGQKYMDSYQDSQDRKANREAAQASRDSLVQSREDKMRQQAELRLAGMLHSVQGPEDYQRIQPILQTFANKFPQYGFEIPKVYDQAWVDTTRDGTMATKDHITLDERERHNRASEANTSDRTNVYRQVSKAGVINNAARTTITAANTGLNAGDDIADNTEGHRHNLETERNGAKRGGRGLARPSANPFAGAPPPPAAGRTLKANGQIVGVAKVVNGKLQWTKP